MEERKVTRGSLREMLGAMFAPKQENAAQEIPVPDENMPFIPRIVAEAAQADALDDFSRRVRRNPAMDGARRAEASVAAGTEGASAPGDVTPAMSAEAMPWASKPPSAASTMASPPMASVRVEDAPPPASPETAMGAQPALSAEPARIRQTDAALEAAGMARTVDLAAQKSPMDAIPDIFEAAQTRRPDSVAGALAAEYAATEKPPVAEPAPQTAAWWEAHPWNAPQGAPAEQSSAPQSAVEEPAPPKAAEMEPSVAPQEAAPGATAMPSKAAPGVAAMPSREEMTRSQQDPQQDGDAWDALHAQIAGMIVQEEANLPPARPFRQADEEERDRLPPSRVAAMLEALWVDPESGTPLQPLPAAPPLEADAPPRDASVLGTPAQRVPEDAKCSPAAPQEMVFPQEAAQNIEVVQSAGSVQSAEAVQSAGAGTVQSAGTGAVQSAGTGAVQSVGAAQKAGAIQDVCIAQNVDMETSTPTKAAEETGAEMKKETGADTGAETKTGADTKTEATAKSGIQAEIEAGTKTEAGAGAQAEDSGTSASAGTQSLPEIPDLMSIAESLAGMTSMQSPTHAEAESPNPLPRIVAEWAPQPHGPGIPAANVQAPVAVEAPKEAAADIAQPISAASESPKPPEIMIDWLQHDAWDVRMSGPDAAEPTLDPSMNAAQTPAPDGAEAVTQPLSASRDAVVEAIVDVSSVAQAASSWPRGPRPVFSMRMVPGTYLVGLVPEPSWREWAIGLSGPQRELLWKCLNGEPIACETDNDDARGIDELARIHLHRDILSREPIELYEDVCAVVRMALECTSAVG